ncbi:MAG: hypothetical protein ACO1N3_00195 [Gammaproteobacteria bacterium]
MKKIIIGLLLCLGSQAYATLCQSLKISIKNDTPSTCYLIEKKIKSGNITKRQPYKVKSGTTIIQFEAEENKKQPINILLTYECGEGHNITLLSTKEVCGLSSSGKIQGTIVKSTSLTAVSTILESGFYNSKPNNILWTIS